MTQIINRTDTAAATTTNSQRKTIKAIIKITIKIQRENNSTVKNIFTQTKNKSYW